MVDTHVAVETTEVYSSVVVGPGIVGQKWPHQDKESAMRRRFFRGAVHPLTARRWWTNGQNRMYAASAVLTVSQCTWYFSAPASVSQTRSDPFSCQNVRLFWSVTGVSSGEMKNSWRLSEAETADRRVFHTSSQVCGVFRTEPSITWRTCSVLNFPVTCHILTLSDHPPVLSLSCRLLMPVLSDVDRDTRRLDYKSKTGSSEGVGARVCRSAVVVCASDSLHTSLSRSSLILMNLPLWLTRRSDLSSSVSRCLSNLHPATSVFLYAVWSPPPLAHVLPVGILITQR